MLLAPGYIQAEDPKTYYNIPDDGYVIVPIPFGFPYYGRVFTHSIMFDNGVVSFYDPLTESARLGGQQFYAYPLSNDIGSNFYYSIIPLWSDLVGNAGSKFYTQTDSSTYLKYSWQDVQQWGYPDRLNSFSLQIKPSGFFGVNYEKVDITGYPVTIGHIGNASVGEWSQIYHQPSGGLTTLASIQGWSVGSTNVVLDCSNPLNSPACTGYAEAYHDQQCSINPLHATTCPGYQQAYYNQQCSANPLYDSGCLGYQQVYFDQQCSLDPLYDSQCPGYAQAYAKEQLLKQQNSSTTIAIITEPVIEIGDDGTVSTNVPLVSDPVANQVITKKPETKKEDSKEEKKDVAVAEKPKAKSTRQAAPAKVDPATQTESEKEFEQTVAAQAAAVNAISFVPGFSAYQNAIIPDTNALIMQRQYNKPTVDNARAMRRLNGASDILHQQMVEDQYR